MQSIDRPTALYCPRCGAAAWQSHDSKLLRCGQCRFQYYHNVACTASLIVCCGDEVAFAVRGQPPGLGLWDFPGGFSEPGETLEQTLMREVSEELSYTPPAPHYGFSCANAYPWGDVLYHTCDAFFIQRCSNKPEFVVGDDVAGIVWAKPADVVPAQLAFTSVVSALQKLGQLYI